MGIPPVPTEVACRKEWAASKGHAFPFLDGAPWSTTLWSPWAPSANDVEQPIVHPSHPLVAMYSNVVDAIWMVVHDATELYGV